MLQSALFAASDNSFYGLAALRAGRSAAARASTTPHSPNMPDGRVNAAQDLALSDSKMRTDLQKLAAEAGPGAQVTVQYRYQVGADGQLYVIGGTVTSTERVPLNEKGALALNPQADSPSRTNSPDALSTLQNAGPVLSPQEQAELFGVKEGELSDVRKLLTADVQVRGHEAQHYRAAGGLAEGGPQYTYVQGPDGSYYAVGGQVNVRSSSAGDEEKAARDAATLANAATAPADGSAQDIAAARQFYNQTAALFQSAANSQPVYMDAVA